MKNKKTHTNNEFSLNDIKGSGFKKPNNYLNTFDDDVFVKIASENFPNKTGYTTPKDYFVSLENTIISKITKSKPNLGILILSSTLKRIIPYAAAAAILLFIGINHYLSTSNFNKITIDDLSATEIENWLYAANNSNEITEVLNITDFEETSITDSMNDVEIENYLDNIDTSTLLNEIN